MKIRMLPVYSFTFPCLIVVLSTLAATIPVLQLNYLPSGQFREARGEGQYPLINIEFGMDTPENN